MSRVCEACIGTAGLTYWTGLGQELELTVTEMGRRLPTSALAITNGQCAMNGLNIFDVLPFMQLPVKLHPRSSMDAIHTPQGRQSLGTNIVPIEEDH